LVELGHEVHVITSGKSHQTHRKDGAYLHEVNSSRRDRYRSFRARGYDNLASWLNHSHAVYDEIRTLQAQRDIQLVDSPLWCVEGLVTVLSKTIPVAVRVVTAMKQIADVHGQVSAENELLGELEDELLRRCDVVISNSQATVETLERVYELDTASVRHGIVPYGMLPTPDREVETLRERSDEEVKVLFVGRLEGRKGILDLFAAIPLVLDRFPNTRFIIAGSDNSEQDGFLKEHKIDYPTFFQRHYRSYTPQVDLLGFVDEDRLDELYRSCDLFVAPSLYESFGLIYLEAMNQCRPVIGCSAGGPKDIIVDGETGRLVPPESPQQLAEAIIELVGSQTLRHDMGLAGRRRLLEKFSHTAMAQGFVELYRRAIKGT
jgi:glycosyltransferase involved in cell wall biosynthesis